MQAQVRYTSRTTVFCFKYVHKLYMYHKRIYLKGDYVGECYRVAKGMRGVQTMADLLKPGICYLQSWATIMGCPKFWFKAFGALQWKEAAKPYRTLDPKTRNP